MLKQHDPRFFRDMDDLVLGDKIVDGGLIYEAGEKYFVKVFDLFYYGSLKNLSSMWKDLHLFNAYDGISSKVGGPFSLIHGATLLKDQKGFKYRFVFLMDRKWQDLQRLIDLQMIENNCQGPPFTLD